MFLMAVAISGTDEMTGNRAKIFDKFSITFPLSCHAVFPVIVYILLVDVFISYVSLIILSYLKSLVLHSL